MNDQTERNALVLGLGASGLAAAALLRREGTRVAVVDSGDSPALRERADALRADGATVVLKAASPPPGRWHMAVISPGVASDGAWASAVVPPGVPVIAELELAAVRCPQPLLAVTGTNGKSTVVKLCADALRRAGRRVACAGNYGTPLSAIAVGDDVLDWIVVEVSSFQLETVDHFHPRVAVLLNILPNHLDRHGDMATYAALKWRLFARMGNGDTAVVPDELAAVIPENGGGAAWRSFGESAAAAARLVGHGVEVVETGEHVDLSGTQFDNPVLGHGAAAAVAALAGCGVGAATVQAAIRDFVALPHRMSDTGTIRGVRFVNNSKATNLAALAASLRMCPERVRLIAGGLLKEKDLAGVEEMLAKRVAGVYLIGKASAAMFEAWSARVACRPCGDMQTAIRAAWADAEPGDCVLLAPGCASFDQYRSFEARGEHFTEIVRRIDEEARYENIIVG